MRQLSNKGSQIEQYNYLSMLKNANETLFYYLLTHHLEQLTPLVYTPTVGKGCQEFSEHFNFPEGMYFSKEDKGQMRAMLDNWPRGGVDGPQIIVVTDGSRILGLGDLGVGGMGIPIGKLSLYVAAAGFHPSKTLPVVLDTGTNTIKYHSDPHYLGTKGKRLDDDEYYPLVDEFLMAVKDKWPKCLVQFEDFSNNHCFHLLDEYRPKMRCFNDDIQGTGAVVAAGFITAAEVSGVPYAEQRICFLGAGSAGIGVADQIVAVMCKKDKSLSIEEARGRFYFIDSQGLVTADRPGRALASHKLPYARKDLDGKQYSTLMEVLKAFKPSSLIGLSGQGGAFTEEVLKEMKKHWPKPTIFALSNPTSNAECSAEEAYKATDGTCLFASGSPFSSVEMNDGRLLVPGQGNNMYIFPGLGFGAYLAQASSVTDGMIIAAVEALADTVTPSDIALGRIYPSLEDIRSISHNIAVKVIEVAIAEGVAEIETPEDISGFVTEATYVPRYI
eukprot:TRINITY_DN156_c1_g3_i1.p1 TRINITY_DN156_c1_g3~~TRINITY_DN156_c1_g3_i1.p1  ORF type:complete len:501 (-),score=157.44 TRINITY_DN156_c1_g3_i1:113-1615(-)